MTLIHLVLSIKLKYFIFLLIVFVTFYLTIRLYNGNDRCSPAEFKIRGMDSCHHLLACQDFKDVKLGKLIGVGAVKAVYHAKWKDFDIALSILNNPNYEADFLSGIQNMKELQQNPFTIQAVGFCVEEKMFLTEYHRNGDATKFNKVIHNAAGVHDGVLLRMNLCYNYAQILSSLHHAKSANGSYLPPRVLCDSNDLQKLLSQFLLTDDLSLILNDLDALPLVGAKGIKCGHKQLEGNFVAPEQRWNLPKEYDDMRMMWYDEKTDIWKVPFVCSHFLDGVRGVELVKNLLMPIHKQCQNLNPSKRPTADELLGYYKMVKEEVESQAENY